MIDRLNIRLNHNWRIFPPIRLAYLLAIYLEDFTSNYYNAGPIQYILTPPPLDTTSAERSPAKMKTLSPIHSSHNIGQKYLPVPLPTCTLLFHWRTCDRTHQTASICTIEASQDLRVNALLVFILSFIFF